MLPKRIEAWGRTQEWTEASMPAGLRRSHTLPTGRWARLRVRAGGLRYSCPAGARTIAAGDTQPIPPGVLQDVEPLGPVRFSVELFVVVLPCRKGRSPTATRTVEGGEAPCMQHLTGRQPIEKLFSKEQRALYAAHAPEGLELGDLSILGPILVLKLKFAPEEYGRKLVAELWLYPDNSLLLELSTKCPPSEAFQVAAETRAFLTQHGIDLSGEQETKTKKALEFFSERLRAEA
jgi:hypothetical protein